MNATGRFAPSPSGTLHLGNLRTALVAWLFARSRQAAFLVRIDDLDPDRSRPELVGEQLADLHDLGIDWDAPPVQQSQRGGLYRDAIGRLRAGDLVYPCFCTRAEIREAASAPHGELAGGAYPGTCAGLSPSEAQRRLDAGEPACLRLRAGAAKLSYDDALQGTVTAVVDDFVVVRKDGVAAYNLATVVDDADQGIGEVVRGADLAETTPRQLLLFRLLGLPAPGYAHVPLLLGADGARLAKRHGSVTLADWRAAGRSVVDARGFLAWTLGLAEPGEHPSMQQLLHRFDPAALPREPFVVDAAAGT